MASGRLARAVDERAVMLHEPFERLPRQIEPVIFGVVALERRHHLERLGVVVEAAERRHGGIQRVLAGVPEGRVAEIVRERHRFGQVLVEAEGAGERTGDLAHLDGMGEPCAEVIALVIDEDLGLVLQPSEGGGMDDAVAVALKRAARWRCGLRMEPAAAGARVGRIGREPALAGLALMVTGLTRTWHGFAMGSYLGTASSRAVAPRWHAPYLSQESRGKAFCDQKKGKMTGITLTERAARRIHHVLEGE